MRLSASICIAVCSLAATAAHAQPAPTEARGFVEGGLGYGWAPSSGPYVEVSNGTQLASASAQGPGLDLAAGVRVVPGLFVMVDLAWSSARTIEGEDQDGDTSRTKVSATSLAIGLRTTRHLGRGRLYADLALGMVLPFESVRSEHMANGESRTTTIGYNTGTGARAEMGYQVPVSGGVYVGGGLRTEAFATDNIGRERRRAGEGRGPPGARVRRRHALCRQPDGREGSDRFHIRRRSLSRGQPRIDELGADPVGPHLRCRQQAQQERDARAARVGQVDQRGEVLTARVQRLGQPRGDLVAAQGPERDPQRARVAGRQRRQRRLQRAPGLGAAGAGDAHQVLRIAGAEDLVEQLQRRRVTPLQVVEHDQQRLLRARQPAHVTLDELGDAWQGGRVQLTLQSSWNGRRVGMCDAGAEMSFHFGQHIAHIAKTRNVRAGSIVGSGTVTNNDWSKGYSCIAEKRCIETIEDGRPSTEFMKYGDTIRIEMKGRDGQSLFGAIDQQSVSHG